MAVKIRLSRIGKIHAPVYRIIAIDSRKKRDGEALDILGTYNPVSGELVQLHVDRINDWVAKGAIVTDAVKKIQKLHKKNTQQAGVSSEKPVKAPAGTARAKTVKSEQKNKQVVAELAAQETTSQEAVEVTATAE